MIQSPRMSIQHRTIKYRNPKNIIPPGTVLQPGLSSTYPFSTLLLNVYCMFYYSETQKILHRYTRKNGFIHRIGSNRLFDLLIP